MGGNSPDAGCVLGGRFPILFVDYTLYRVPQQLASSSLLTQYYEYNKTLVYHQRVRLHRRGGIVERVGVLRRFALQLTLVGEGTSTTITEESIMPDELDVVTRVARLDAVDADRVPVRRVARVAPVKVVHRERRVRANLVQTLPPGDGLFHFVLIVEDLVASRDRLDAASQTESTKLVVEDLVKLQRCGGIVRDLDSGC